MRWGSVRAVEGLRPSLKVIRCVQMCPTNDNHAPRLVLPALESTRAGGWAGALLKPWSCFAPMMSPERHPAGRPGQFNRGVGGGKDGRVLGRVSGRPRTQVREGCLGRLWEFHLGRLWDCRPHVRKREASA